MPSTSRSETIHPLSPSVVRDLAAWSGLPVITSLYLDIDGRRYPRRSELQPEIALLMRTARDQAASLGTAAEAAVEADLGHVRRWLAQPFDRAARRGIAFFSCDHKGLFTAVGLSTPVYEQVAVGPTPALSQLCDALPRGARALVVLVDRRGARFVRLEQGRIDEHPGPIDEPPRQVDTDVELGSFERFHEEAARHHFRRVADALTQEIARWPTQRLVLGGDAEAVAGLEQHLPPALGALVVGRIALPMTSAPVALERAAREPMAAFDEKWRSTLVDDLRQRVERGTGGVAGVAATLVTLREHRVATLVVTRGFAVPGRRCPQCGWTGVEEGAVGCRECRAPTDPLTDVVDAAVCDAISQDADVLPCDSAELRALGGLGALERF